MKGLLTTGLILLAVLAIASCDLFGGDAPELQVLARPLPGDTAADMASGNEIYFGKPNNGVNVDLVFTIRNTGSEKLKLEAGPPHYVTITDQNEAEEPFSVLVGASTNSIGSGNQVEVTLRFTGQSTSTRYAAKLLVPSNDEEHPDYYLDLLGDGESFN